MGKRIVTLNCLERLDLHRHNFAAVEYPRPSLYESRLFVEPQRSRVGRININFRRNPQQFRSFWPKGICRDFRSEAVVEETKERAPFLTEDAGEAGEVEPPAVEGDGPEYCRVVLHKPLRVELEAQLDWPGLVVLCDQFRPGWRLEVETDGRESETVPILRTNRVMRGAWLSPGRHRLVWRYRPGSFRIGAAVSALSWIFLGIGLIVTLRRQIPSTTNHN